MSLCVVCCVGVCRCVLCICSVCFVYVVCVCCVCYVCACCVYVFELIILFFRRANESNKKKFMTEFVTELLQQCDTSSALVPDFLTVDKRQNIVCITHCVCPVSYVTTSDVQWYETNCWEAAKKK